MTDEATRRAILARRARFLAAALATTFPVEGCKREGDIGADEAEGTKGQKPQACLKTVEGPTEATPQECLKIAPPPSDAGPIPHPCLKVAIPEEDLGAPDGGAALPAAPSVEVKGSADATALITRNRWRFRRCQAKALATDPKAAGAVIVAIEIGEAGKPKDVKGSGASTELAKCTSETLGALTFPDAPGTKLTVTVTYPAKS